MPTRPPSIVFLTTDTMGREMCSAYVNRPGVETPHLERFAASATLFENAFASCPLCTPARSTWYSGLHPNRNGAWCNNVAMRRGLPLLAELLSAAGYATAHLGKWHLDSGSYNGHGHPDGGFAAPWYDLTNFLAEVGLDGPGPRRFGGWTRGLEEEAFCFGHRVADRAIDVLKAHDHGKRPLFLAVEFDEPHGPYIAPPPFNTRFSFDEIYRPPTLNADMTGKPRIQQEYAAFLRANRKNPEDLPHYYEYYYNCNAYVDSELGRVLDAIQAFCPPDTVVIYTADHGDHLGAFGLCAKGPTLYDQTTAVPLIVRAPGLSSTARRVAGLTSSVDLWPTILDCAGVDRSGFTARRGYTGVSLAPVLRGETESVRDHVIVEYNRFGIAQTQDDGFFPIRGIRTDRWKLNLNLVETDELYDLERDPHETTNRILDPNAAEVRDALHDRLLAWQDETQDPFRGPPWTRRPWRADAAHTFEGLFTTGYKDRWPEREFIQRLETN